VKQDWAGNVSVVMPSQTSTPSDVLLYRIYRDRKCFSVITPYESGKPKLVASIERCVRKGSDWNFIVPISYSLSHNKRFGIHINAGILLNNTQKAVLVGVMIALVSFDRKRY